MKIFFSSQQLFFLLKKVLPNSQFWKPYICFSNPNFPKKLEFHRFFLPPQNVFFFYWTLNSIFKVFGNYIFLPNNQFFSKKYLTSFKLIFLPLVSFKNPHHKSSSFTRFWRQFWIKIFGGIKWEASHKSKCAKVLSQPS